MDEIKVKQGDFSTDALQITVTESGGTIPVNLTLCTVNLKIWAEFTPGTVLWTLVGTITDAPNGEVNFAQLATDCNVAGQYYGEVEWTKAGVKRSSQTFKVTVEESP